MGFEAGCLRWIAPRCMPPVEIECAPNNPHNTPIWLTPLQDAAERAVLLRMEGSRAVPAMLLVEATKRLNVGGSGMAGSSKPCIPLHAAVPGAHFLCCWRRLPLGAAGQPITAPDCLARWNHTSPPAVCRWGWPRTLWTLCCSIWSAAMRQQRRPLLQPASRRQQVAVLARAPLQWRARCTQSTQPVSGRV